MIPDITSRLAGRWSGCIGRAARAARAAREALPATTVALLLTTAGAAHAQSFRCELDGHVSYGDKPCVAGKQTTIAPGAAVDPAARADAAARQRRDQDTLSRIERERQQDQKAAALSKRRDTDIARHAQACAKLSRRVRDTHDAYDTSGPRDQAKNLLKMQRAQQDFAALCKH